MKCSLHWLLEPTWSVMWVLGCEVVLVITYHPRSLKIVCNFCCCLFVFFVCFVLFFKPLFCYFNCSLKSGILYITFFPSFMFCSIVGTLVSIRSTVYISVNCRITILIKWIHSNEAHISRHSQHGAKSICWLSLLN